MMIIVELENIVNSSVPCEHHVSPNNTDQMTIYLDVSAGLLRSEKNNRKIIFLRRNDKVRKTSPGLN